MESGTPKPTRAERRAARRAARRNRRRILQTALHRVVATFGVIGIGAALGAILDSQDVDGWIIGFAVAVETVLLTVLVWIARERERA
jgi:hypothetical protein